VYCGIERCFFEVSIRTGVFRYAMSKRVVTTDSSKDVPPVPPNLGQIMARARRSSLSESTAARATQAAQDVRPSASGVTLHDRHASAPDPSLSVADGQPGEESGTTVRPEGRIIADGLPLAGPRVWRACASLAVASDSEACVSRDGEAAAAAIIYAAGAPGVVDANAASPDVAELRTADGLGSALTDSGLAMPAATLRPGLLTQSLAGITSGKSPQPAMPQVQTWTPPTS
jgi:hypothetical protein